ncbi:MAG: fasciclin domain-containing protein [Aggregatilineales bacterium]
MRKVSMLLLLLVVAVFAVTPAFANGEPGTIADIVVASATGEMPEFTILLTAVQAADPGILEALSNPDIELTVFAPTDAAFGALIEALGEEAFNEIVADQALLTSILQYHVVAGAVFSEDVLALLEANDGMFKVPTLNGQFIDIYEDMGEIFVDDARLVLEMVDIEASNGVIHVIDAVILPETATIAEIVTEAAAAEMGEFTTLLAAVMAADPAVLEALSDPDASLTVFAPTDAAFAALGEDTINAVVSDQELVTNILLYHVIAGRISSVQLVEMLTDAMGELEVETLQGSTVVFTTTDEGIFINDAQIIMTDIDAGNGVIHVIDAVILPE